MLVTLDPRKRYTKRDIEGWFHKAGGRLENLEVYPCNPYDPEDCWKAMTIESYSDMIVLEEILDIL